KVCLPPGQSPEQGITVSPQFPTQIRHCLRSVVSVIEPFFTGRASLDTQRLAAHDKRFFLWREPLCLRINIDSRSSTKNQSN
ncbi:hypothetical protein, partial [Cupriavidus sp. WS]|uniref:hypothetical protein n=1 Tax=Cupriavidus sp. WS TaxID=1312922 RepID=UPI001E4957C2